MKIYNGHEWCDTKFDWGYNNDQEYVQHLFDENRILKVALKKLYDISKEVANEIISLGGDMDFVLLVKRENLSRILLYVQKVLTRNLK